MYFSPAALWLTWMVFHPEQEMALALLDAAGVFVA
jgi:hypothetical protein